MNHIPLAPDDTTPRATEFNMVTTVTALDALSLALAVARSERREVHSLKDLLCDACGCGVAVRAGGYCHRCADEMDEQFAARAAEHHPAVVDGQSDEGAEYIAAMYDDAETASYLAGIRA